MQLFSADSAIFRKKFLKFNLEHYIPSAKTI